MYVLPLVTAVFLPLGFLAGLFGANLGGIPGADHAEGFWIFVGILVAVVGVELLLMRFMKWF